MLMSPDSSHFQEKLGIWVCGGTAFNVYLLANHSVFFNHYTKENPSTRQIRWNGFTLALQRALLGLEDTSDSPDRNQRSPEAGALHTFPFNSLLKDL